MHDFLPKYPDDELPLLNRIHQLMAEWKRSSADELFTSDGFYPYYTHQAIKVLFVGREGIGLAGCDYIEALFQAYQQNRIGNKSVNGYTFHRRLLYMLYGIQNGFPEWSDVPAAQAIAQTFATPSGISCAFLNLTKTSNERGHWATDMQALLASLDRDAPFLQKEVALLNPDLIISSNFSLNTAFSTTPQLLSKHPEDLLDVHRCELNGRTVYWFNMFHFSAYSRGRGNPGLNDYHSFYLPLKNAFETHFPVQRI